MLICAGQNLLLKFDKIWFKIEFKTLDIGFVSFASAKFKPSPQKILNASNFRKNIFRN